MLLQGNMWMTNQWNQIRYGIYAPIFDWVVLPLEKGRRYAINRVDPDPDERILIVGCGTGMDLEYLPTEASVTAIDLTPAMVQRAATRSESLDCTIDLVNGDAHKLPFADGTFDIALLHGVLSVVTDPDLVMSETTRVLTSNGRVSIYDKFVPEGTKPSLPRRIINPLARFLFSDLNRHLKPIVADTGLKLENPEPVAGGIYSVTIGHFP